MSETYKRLRKNPLVRSGHTFQKAYVPVVSGFFEFVNGQGLPLDVVLHYFKDNGMTPCWVSFFIETLDHGWNPKSTLSKIEAACEDVYGSKHAAIVVSKLQEYIDRSEERKAESVRLG